MKYPDKSDFALDYEKYPKRKKGGISDMNMLNRLDDRDVRYELAKDLYVQSLEALVAIRRLFNWIYNRWH